MNEFGRRFNEYHTTYAAYSTTTRKVDIEITVRYRLYGSDTEKWAAWESETGTPANGFYAMCRPMNATYTQFEIWGDIRTYGEKDLTPPHVVGHEAIHAMAFRRAYQNSETWPPHDFVDADQYVYLENGATVGNVTKYSFGIDGLSTSEKDMLRSPLYFDKSKRILGEYTADWYSVKVLGQTSGPIPVYFGTAFSGSWHVVTADVQVNLATDLDTGVMAGGKDYYVYAVLSGGVVAYKISLSSAYPAGYSGACFLLGGFHTLSVPVADYNIPVPFAWQANTGIWHGYWCTPTVANGYKYRAQYQATTGATEPTWPTTPGDFVWDTGGTYWHCSELGQSGRYRMNVIVASIWDLKHRARCGSNIGMTYDSKTGIWLDIYPASNKHHSALGGTIDLANRWMTAVTYGHAVGKRLCTDHEYQSAAEGIFEETQCYGTPSTAGDNVGLFVLYLDSAPAPADFRTGQYISGTSSGKYCQCLYKISPTQYVCRNLTGAFTDGEIITDGVNSRDCAATWPQYAPSNQGRIVSNIGCEDMAGVFDYWLLDQGFTIVGADYATAKTYATIDLEDHRGGSCRQSEVKMVAGGTYFEGAFCGSQSRKLFYDRNATVGVIAARYCCESL